MRFCYTEEMRELRKIYEPYKEGCHLRADAPIEAVEAEKKFMKLFKEMSKREAELL